MARPVKRTEFGQQRARLGKRRPRRSVEESETRRIGNAEGRAIENQAGKVRLQNLRWRKGLKCGRLLRPPKANRDPGFGAPSPPGALVGGGPRHTHRLQPRQARRRFIFRLARKAAVNDDAHAIDRDRGLGDGGGEHDLAPAPGRRTDCSVLRAAFHRTEERHDIGIGRDPVSQPLGRALDLAPSGKEGQDAAALGGECIEYGAGNRVLDRRAGGALAVADIDGKAAAMAFDDRRAAHYACNAGAVDGRRHDQDRQVFTQAGLYVERQRQAEIAVERAFVELVEQHRRYAGQFRVVENHGGEHALGHHQDAGCVRLAAVHAHGVADRPARLLAEQGGHASGRGARGQTARFQKHDPAIARKRKVQQVERHQCCLARAGRRHENGLAASLERSGDLRQHGGYRQDREFSRRHRRS